MGGLPRADLALPLATLAPGGWRVPEPGQSGLKGNPSTAEGQDEVILELGAILHVCSVLVHADSPLSSGRARHRLTLPDALECLLESVKIHVE